MNPLPHEQERVIRTLYDFGKLTQSEAENRGFQFSAVKQLKTQQLIANNSTHIYLSMKGYSVAQTLTAKPFIHAPKWDEPTIVCEDAVIRSILPTNGTLMKTTVVTEKEPMLEALYQYIPDSASTDIDHEGNWDARRFGWQVEGYQIQISVLPADFLKREVLFVRVILTPNMLPKAGE